MCARCSFSHTSSLVARFCNKSCFLCLSCVFFCLLENGFDRAHGELEVLRHRLEALSKEKDSVAVGASAKVEELEAKVLEGELQRRKMHNLIQVAADYFRFYRRRYLR